MSNNYFFPNLYHWMHCKDEACELYGKTDADILKNDMKILDEIATIFVDDIRNEVLQSVSFKINS